MTKLRQWANAALLLAGPLALLVVETAPRAWGESHPSPALIRRQSVNSPAPVRRPSATIPLRVPGRSPATEPLALPSGQTDQATPRTIRERNPR
jgi:hypothetical protein